MTENYNFNLSQEFQDIQHLCSLSARYPLLTKERERELLIQAHCDDPDEVYKATNLLVLHNLRMIIKKAREFAGRGIPLEDLVQEATLGCIRAIEKFDVSRGTRFSTYCTMWLEQKVRRAIENKSRLVRVPLNVLAKITTLKKKYKKLQEDMNRPPTSEEIAALLNITEEEARDLGRAVWPHVSLDDSGEEESSLSMLNYLVDEHLPADEQLEHREDKGYIHALLGMLSVEDAQFMKLMYGFLDQKPRTYKEMSSILKIPAKEIEAREKRILELLKDFADTEQVNFE